MKEITKEYIQENLFTISGKLNSVKTRLTGHSALELYLIFHDCKKPTCVCGNELRFISFEKGFRQSCSIQCAAINPDKRQKISNAYKNMSEEKKRARNDKTEKTNIERYGCSRPAQNELIKTNVKEYFLDTYGVDNPMKLDKHKKFGTDNRFSTYRHIINPMKLDSTKKNFGSDNFFGTDIGKDIIRSRLETLGLWIPLNQKSDYELYSRQVWLETRKNNLKILPNYDKRGPKDYHLDHKYSIFEGFKNNILPSIIGNIKNLEFIPYKENLTKGKKSSVDIDYIL